MGPTAQHAAESSPAIFSVDWGDDAPRLEARHLHEKKNLYEICFGLWYGSWWVYSLLLNHVSHGLRSKLYIFVPVLQ